MNPTGLPLRLQAQIPSTRRDFRTLLENIAGNVVNGKVHPPRLVTGTPVAASAVLTAITLTAKSAGSEWNDVKIWLENSEAALSVVYDPAFDPPGSTHGLGKYIRIKYQYGVTTYGELETLIGLASPFDASDNGVGGMEPTDTIPETVQGLESTATSGGKDLECFPDGPKDYVRVIQNCGTNAVKILYSNTGQASASQFHQVLTACSTQDDGTGGNVSVVCSERVTAIGADGNAVRLAITRIESPEAI